MTRPRVVADRGEPDGVSNGPVVPAMSVWPMQPPAPVAGALSRFSLLLPGGIASPVRMTPRGRRPLSDRMVAR